MNTNLITTDIITFIFMFPFLIVSLLLVWEVYRNVRKRNVLDDKELEAIINLTAAIEKLAEK